MMPWVKGETVIDGPRPAKPPRRTFHRLGDDPHIMPGMVGGDTLLDILAAMSRGRMVAQGLPPLPDLTDPLRKLPPWPGNDPITTPAQPFPFDTTSTTSGGYYTSNDTSANDVRWLVPDDVVGQALHSAEAGDTVAVKLSG